MKAQASRPHDRKFSRPLLCSFCPRYAPSHAFHKKDNFQTGGLASFKGRLLFETGLQKNLFHYGAKQKLREVGIPFERRGARQITHADYEKYDLLIGMDDENIWYMNRCWAPDPERKIVRLLSYAGKTRDIADPWYTGNFDQTYEDILEGCTALCREYL